MGHGRSQRAVGTLLRPSFAQEIETGDTEEASGQTAQVFQFRRTGPVAEESHHSDPEVEAARKKKISRILGVAIEKLDDDQLGSLLDAVERITGAAHSD